jgi:type III secretion protein V
MTTKRDTSISKDWFRGIQNRIGDIALAAAVMAVVVMMVVPLRPWLVDLLISVNLGVSLLVICLAIFISRPLAFTAFPTMLLVATLYRLALNVSSTRLILLHADAGQIIGGFGGYIVGGDILIGAVIFGILSMVLFLVITKGAERVAEVAARFTLDALPGMQIAIDSDLRGGAISPIEASRKRSMLDRQSHYYGALDGAMKFVRGDAIAGLVIVGVNIVGGLAVGMIRHGMTASQAIDTYGRLTVGDGLVTMIPALLISTAAGLLVTRVGQSDDEERLGKQLGRQLTIEPRALLVATVMMLILAAAPGLPVWPFALIAALLGLGTFSAYSRERKAAKGMVEPLDELEEANGKETSAIFELGPRIYSELVEEARFLGGWRSIGRELARPLHDRLGLPLSSVPMIEGAKNSGERTVVLRVRGSGIRQLTIPLESSHCSATIQQLEGIGVKSTLGIRKNANWIFVADEPIVKAAGFEVSAPLAGIIIEGQRWLKEAARQLLGIDETQALIDRLAISRPALVRETVPRIIGLPALNRLLGELIDDGIGLENTTAVLEVLANLPADEIAGGQLAERVRQRLSQVITANLRSDQGTLSVMILDPEVEDVLLTSLTKTSKGPRLALAAETLGQLETACHDMAKFHDSNIVMVGHRLRRPLAELLPDLRLIAHGEIEPHTPVNVIGRVEL